MRLWQRVFFALMALVLSACHTVEGIGKDLQAGGRAVEKAAK